jgi:hypothetical protein
VVNARAYDMVAVVGHLPDPGVALRSSIARLTPTEPSALLPSRQLQSRISSPAGMHRPGVLPNSYGSTRDYFPIYVGHYSRILLAWFPLGVGALGRCSRSRHWNSRHTRHLKPRCATVVCDRCKINLASTWHHCDPQPCKFEQEQSLVAELEYQFELPAVQDLRP